MPRNTFSVGALNNATPGLSRLAYALGGDGGYQKAYDSELTGQSRVAQALASARASDAEAGLRTAQTGEVQSQNQVLANRPDIYQEQVAANAGTDVPMVAAIRKMIQTGQAPQVPMGPPADDGSMGVGSQQFDPAVKSKVLTALQSLAPIITNTGDLNAESLAKARSTDQDTQQESAAQGNPALLQQLAQRRYASKGSAPFTQDSSGSVLSPLFGTVDQTNPIAVSNVKLKGAQANDANAGATAHLAAAGNSNATAAKTRLETTQLGDGTNEGFSPAAIENAAARYNLDGTLPPMGMGKAGSAGRQAILNRAAELNIGTSGTDQRIGQIDAKNAATALSQVGKAKAMNGAFEQTANANADLALGLSDKVDRTGIPMINAGLQALRTGTGSPEATQFAAATGTFVSEYAKIMSGGMGNSPVSDAAAKKASNLLTTSMTADQFKGNVQLLQKEMRNRMQGFDDQENQIRTKMRGGSSTPAPSGLPSASDIDAEIARRRR